MRNLPPITALEPPPLPQRQRLDTEGSFEPVGISEVLGEPEIIANRFNLDTVEIEELQTNEFARNFNSPLTDLNDHVIVQVRPFDSPVLGVLVGRVMSSAEESSFVFTSTILVEGVLHPPVSTPRYSFPSTPLTPASRVVQPPVHSNLAGTSGDMVTGTPVYLLFLLPFHILPRISLEWGAHSPIQSIRRSITFLCRSAVWE